MPVWFPFIWAAFTLLGVTVGKTKQEEWVKCSELERNAKFTIKMPQKSQIQEDTAFNLVCKETVQSSENA